ncbi:MAG: AAA family ATPase [Specibacter sp.]
MEIQAFGPFAGRESVDFDTLGAQGLFLLNGPTGAGKTSVLDAVAFALYGQVPGARNGAVKRLRSHHAAAGVGPEVVCEFSAGGRRLEVRRSPEWMRPAKRGTGTTREQASTQLREKVDGSWVALSQRNDEAASEIQGLLGMNMEQFTKVILLAQGDFAAFLRASAKDREDLLEKLFGTEIYQDLEIRLAADAREAAAAVQAGLAQLAAHEQLARSQGTEVLEAAGIPGDDAPMDDDAAAAVPDDSAEAAPQPGWASSGVELLDWLAESLDTAVALAAGDVADKERESAAALEAVAVAEGRLGRHTLRDTALAEHARLAGMAQDAAQWTQSLARHHGAEVLAAVVDAAATTAQEHATAESAVGGAADAFATNELAAESSQAAGAAAGGETAPSIDVLAHLEKDLAGQVAAVQAAMPGEKRLLAAGTELAAGQAAFVAANRDMARHHEAESIGKATLLDLKSEAAALGAEAVSVQQARELHDTSVARVTNIAAHKAQAAVVAELAGSSLTAREHAVGAKRTWLDAVELRLSLAAGELAAKLVDGEPCQVCGSTVHPAPSVLAGSGVEAVQAEKKAKTASQTSEKLAADAQSALADARQVLAVLAERGGDGDPVEARAAVVQAKETMDAAIAAAARAAALATESEAVEAAVATAQAALLKATGRVSTLAAANAALSQEIAQLEEILAAARAGFSSLAERQGSLAVAQQLTWALMAALRRRDTTQRACEAAAHALEKALAGSDFADAAEVRAALLDRAAAHAMAEQLAAFGRATTLNTAQLELPEVAAAALEAGHGVAVPDGAELEQLRTRTKDRALAARDAGVRLGLARKAAVQVAQTSAAFHDCEERVAPLRERSALLAGLADAVRGAGDNQLKMTLTSYVLAARLEQVAMAASVRLSTMSGSRYTLSHSDAKAGGNRKSGLGLEVVDEWTQMGRDTATLSGGESFMASLALALGLADVVQQESGGLDIETLFVDEGFGSLDEESLDQVMDALEGLRDGGRVVGLVSHVAEMKTRIPVHLQVNKGRNGSTLSVGEAG